MERDVSSLIKPRTVAVLGASGKKMAQGNTVIDNLLSRGYQGQIIPVHRDAESIQGLATVKSINDLPEGVDLAIASVPASAAADTALELEKRNVKSAIFYASGFSKAEIDRFQSVADQCALNIHGPNCMGLINLTHGIYLYPAKTSSKPRPGNVSLIAQSGSAAITLMNSAEFGFSKIITVGSEYQLTAADYMRWLAEDDETAVIGVVLEAINDPSAFSRAAELIFANKKSLVVLKVGTSKAGSAATLAHTGSMTSDADTYRLFFEANGIASVDDYDELNAALEILLRYGHRESCRSVAIAGISGGQTALACDVATSVGLELAEFGGPIEARLREQLPGSMGQNPIDFGAVVDPGARDVVGSIKTILGGGTSDVIAVIQDCQAGLNERSIISYSGPIDAYCESTLDAEKPIVAISPTSEEIHSTFRAKLEAHGIPIVSGLREGLVGIRALSTRPPDKSIKASGAPSGQPSRQSVLSLLEEEGGSNDTQVSLRNSYRILNAYGIPTIRSLVVKCAEDAVTRVAEVGFPLVVKVASKDISHRSELGGVILGVKDMDGLDAAIRTIAENIRKSAPEAAIDGFELQEEFHGDLEAVAGFVAAPPFGVKIIAGTGGTLVELFADHAMALGPLTVDEAKALIAETKLGKRMEGYRNLIPKTDPGPLAELIANLSTMASEIGDHVKACDLNPIVVRAGSGQVAVVDVLLTR